VHICFVSNNTGRMCQETPEALRCTGARGDQECVEEHNGKHIYTLARNDNIRNGICWPKGLLGRHKMVQQQCVGLIDDR
jgi:hypothetical protein